MTLKKIKTVIKYAIGGLLLGLLVFAFIPEPVPVDMGVVQRGDVLIALDGEGKTRIHDIYTVSAPIEGRVTRIEIEPGDDVRAGETVIANMHPADPRFLDSRSETQARADVEGAVAGLALGRSQVKQAEAQLDFANAEYKRSEELFRKKHVSIAALERAELQLRNQKAELETSQSNLKVMESRLEAARASLQQPGESKNGVATNCQICVKTPVDGKVLRILHKSEGVIQQGTPLAEIGNPQDLEIVIEMLSTNAVRVKVGDLAHIKRWGGEDNINARVRVVEPSGYTKISALGVEEQRVNVILDFMDPVEKWGSLGDAFRVEAAIIVDRATDVLFLPLSALFRSDEDWSIFVISNGEAELRKVTVGRRNDRIAEITAGVGEGDRVVIHPGNDVTDGVRVVER